VCESEERYMKATPTAKFGMIVWECSAHDLKTELIEQLEKVAAAYAAATGEPLRVLSGRRTLQRQAELMAGMNDTQLLGLYARQGTPDYITCILKLRAGGLAPTAAQLLDILRQRKEGFVSSHLFGAAVDLAPDCADLGLLKSLLRGHGFGILDERDQGLNCLHARCLACPDEIIRD